MEYVQRGEPIIATSCVGEGRSVGEVDVVLGRVTQMLLHAAANMSMRNGVGLTSLLLWTSVLRRVVAGSSVGRCGGVAW